MERDTSSTPAAPPTLRERKRAEARARTVDVALALFRERGYEDVTVNDICAAADIAPRTFFRYFPGKEDVLLEPVRTMAERVTAFVDAAPADEDDATVVRDAMRDLGAHTLADGGRVLGALTVVSRTDVLRSSPALLMAGRERVLADHLAGRAGDGRTADWRTRLLVARTVAGFRVWLDEVRAERIADPLGLLDEILAAAAAPSD